MLRASLGAIEFQGLQIEPSPFLKSFPFLPNDFCIGGTKRDCKFCFSGKYLPLASACTFCLSPSLEERDETPERFLAFHLIEQFLGLFGFHLPFVGRMADLAREQVSSCSVFSDCWNSIIAISGYIDTLVSLSLIDGLIPNLSWKCSSPLPIAQLLSFCNYQDPQLYYL